MISASSMHEAGHLELILWDNQRDGVGREWRWIQDGGTYVYRWLIHVDVWQKLSQYCKLIVF